MKVKDILRREFAKDSPFHGELGVADCLKEQRNFQNLSNKLCLTSYWSKGYSHFQTTRWQGNWNDFDGLIRIEPSQGFVDKEKMGNQLCIVSNLPLSLPNGVTEEVG